MTARALRPFAAAALLLLLAAGAEGREIAGTRTVRGELVVEEGETLTLLAGSRLRFVGGRLLVRGVLSVRGTAARPVRISGDGGYEGIEVRGKDGSRIEGALLSGGRRGLSVTNARVELSGSTFEKCGVGLEVGQYARVEARDCRFGRGSKVGVVVKRGGAASFASCRFSGASRAGLYVYGAREVSASACRFEKNDTGLLVSLVEGGAAVTRCTFAGNGTGLRAEKMAAPAVSGGDFTGNGTGLLFTHRARGTVTGALVEDNGEGVRVEYSSYPVFRKNRFRRNRGVAVRLVHQSSQWEEAATAADREGGEGFSGAPFGGDGGGRGDFRPGSAGAARGVPEKDGGGKDGTVDFRDNDWGEGGAEHGGPGGGRAVRDAVEEPSFEYRGARYRMDRVLY